MDLELDEKNPGAKVQIINDGVHTRKAKSK